MADLDTENKDGPQRKRQLVKDIAKVLAIALLFVAFAVLLESEFVRTHFDIDSWRISLQQGQFAGGRINAAILFVLAGSVAISMGVPRILVAVFAGAVYGAVTGSVLALCAALIGASVLHQFGRFALRNLMNRWLSGKFEVWRNRFRQNDFWWVLYGRLFPFANSTVLSLLCGSCEVPFRPYLLASFLGFIPLTVVFALFGSGGAKAHTGQIALGMCLMLLVFLSRKFLRMIFPVKPDKTGNDQTQL
jgi:uncharacterized membrane protein YdjX (TVP38/TMEM64 family)